MIETDISLSFDKMYRVTGIPSLVSP